MKENRLMLNLLSILCLVSLLAACAPAPAATEAPAADAPVTLTYLVDDSQNTQDTTKALVDAYTAQHPNVTINIET